MGKIKKILENELVGGTQNTDVYPVTSTKAVYDENNESLDNILNRRGVVNISTNYNSEHTAEVLTLAQAFSKVPSTDRVLGFQGKYLASDGWHTIIYIGNSLTSWSDGTKWIDLADKVFNSISNNATFAGIATPTTNPGTPDGPVFYIATEAGTYSNFNGISIADGEAVILQWNNGVWTKKTTGLPTQQQIDIAGVRISELEYYFKSDNPNVVEVVWKKANGHWNEMGVFTSSGSSDISEPIDVSSYKYYGYLCLLPNYKSIVAVDESGNFAGETIIRGRLSGAMLGLSLFVFKVPESVNYISLSCTNSYKTKTKLFKLNSPFLMGIADNTVNTSLLVNSVENLELEALNNDIDFELTPDDKVQSIFASKVGNYGDTVIFEVKESLGVNIRAEVSLEGSSNNVFYQWKDTKGIKVISIPSANITKYKIYVRNNPKNLSGRMPISVYSSLNTKIWLNKPPHQNFFNNTLANKCFEEFYLLTDFTYDRLYMEATKSSAGNYVFQIALRNGSAGVFKQIIKYSTYSLEMLLEYLNSLRNKVLFFASNQGGCILNVDFFISEFYASGSYMLVQPEEIITSKIINKNVCEALESFNTVSNVDIADYFSTSVMQQNYFDDINRSNLKEMVRNDVVVINQANVGLTEDNSIAYPDLRIINSKGEVDTISSGLLDNTVLTGYKYFYWNDVQSSENVYDFSTIKDYIADAVNKKHRVSIRIFPTCINSKYNTFEKDGITYRLSFPEYVAQKMVDNGSQFVTYGNNNDLLLDVNDEDVYVEYSKLITNFAEWLNTERITYENNEISIKDFILYIDFGFIGPWGEGDWYNLQVTNTVENLLRYYNNIITSIPDILITTGLTLSSEPKTSELFYKIRQLKNSKGHFGTFLDHFGSKNAKILSNSYTYMNKPIKDWVIEFMNRGDFFTGEFAMFSTSWGGNIPTYLYKHLKMFKIPYIRIHNISYKTTNSKPSINKISKSIFYKINSCLSMVGFRYVYNLIYYKKNIDNSLTLSIELTNIGLNKCFFDIYELFYRIKNKDNNEITDIKIDFDLNTLMPKNTEPLEYSLGDGKVIESTISELPENYSISIIGKDKYNLQSPLYFSNYGRQEDGSYLLIE